MVKCLVWTQKEKRRYRKVTRHFIQCRGCQKNKSPHIGLMLFLWFIFHRFNKNTASGLSKDRKERQAGERRGQKRQQER